MCKGLAHGLGTAHGWGTSRELRDLGDFGLGYLHRVGGPAHGWRTCMRIRGCKGVGEMNRVKDLHTVKGPDLHRERVTEMAKV